MINWSFQQIHSLFQRVNKSKRKLKSWWKNETFMNQKKSGKEKELLEWEANDFDLLLCDASVRSIILRHVLELKINKAKFSAGRLHKSKRISQATSTDLFNFPIYKLFRRTHSRKISIDAEVYWHKSILLRNICIKSESFRNKNIMDPSGSLIV